MKLIDILLKEAQSPQWIAQEEQQILQRIGNWNYFKKDPSDPWEPSFFSKSIKDVKISDIIYTETPSEDKLKKYGDYIEKDTPKNEYDTKFPVAIEYQGKIYLLDGHHRVELAKRAGKTTIKIAIKNVTDKYK
jgi:hypothetical protein